MDFFHGDALTRLLGTSDDAGADAPSKWPQAFGWGVLSASSLIFGAGVGIYRLPSKVVRAALMAFGGGALIEALSIELFAHIIATARGGHGGSGASGSSGGGDIDRPLVFVALVAAICGGLLFAGLDRALSNHGAFLRKASTVRAYAGRLRYALIRRLIARLQRVPMFEVLTEQQLQHLAKSMVKEKYAAGATIFRELRSDSSIFFILSGYVKLTVAHASSSSAPETPRITSTNTGPRKNSSDLVVDHFRLGPNDIFGEMALFTSETLQATAVTLEPSCVLRIPSAAIHHILATNKRLQNFVAMTAIDRLREAEVFALCTPSTVARLVSFMKQGEFEAGDVLFYDVDAVCPIYLVILGRVEVVTMEGDSDKGGTERSSRRVVCSNELLGTEHLQLGRASHSVATALERTTVLVIQRKDVDLLCEQDVRFQQAVLAAGKQGREGATVALTPPEGMVAPQQFGSLSALGWHKEGTPIHDTEGIDIEIPARYDCSEDTIKGSLCDGMAPTQHGRPDAMVEVPAAFSAGDDADDRDGDFRDDLDAAEGGGGGVNDTDLPELLANADAAANDERRSNASGDHGGHGHGHGRGMQAAIMIWLGILIDSVPESLVMGILVNSASQGTLLAFVVGVFLANFPEAMSSAGTMHLHGMRRAVIMLMWLSITILTGLGALIGAAVFPADSKEDPQLAKFIAAIEGCCGGAMLCMIANTVLPEAFEQGGNVTGLSTLMGFLVAIAVSVAA